MKRNYKISDIRKALDTYEHKHQKEQTISFTELEQITKKFRTPVVYHIDELINLLSDYITQDQSGKVMCYRERVVCEILKVKKLAMHQWRKNGYIQYQILPPKSIRYVLPTLLDDLKNIRDKNISIESV